MISLGLSHSQCCSYKLPLRYSYSYLVILKSKVQTNFHRHALVKIFRGHGQVEPHQLPTLLSTPRRLITVSGCHVIS